MEQFEAPLMQVNKLNQFRALTIVTRELLNDPDHPIFSNLVINHVKLGLLD